jgi:hypothetical protein
VIREAALIMRVVTPNWPGDPNLSAAGGGDIRTEYVRRDRPNEPVTWTLRRDEGQHYPTHLAASSRAKELGVHCHASVVGGDREQIFLTTQGGAGPSRTGDVARLRLRQTVGSNPTSATNLPAEDRSSSGAEEQRSLSQHKRKDIGSRPAGKTFSKRARLAALKASTRRLDGKPDQQWYRQGQYA